MPLPRLGFSALRGWVVGARDRLGIAFLQGVEFGLQCLGLGGGIGGFLFSALFGLEFLRDLLGVLLFLNGGFLFVGHFAELARFLLRLMLVEYHDLFIKHSHDRFDDVFGSALVHQEHVDNGLNVVRGERAHARHFAHHDFGQVGDAFEESNNEIGAEIGAQAIADAHPIW